MAGLRSFNLCVQIAPPTITSQPLSQVVAMDAPVSFSVQAKSDGPLSYQWLFNGMPIPGQTASVYSIAHADASHVGSYVVKVSNAGGSIDSVPATLSLFGLHVAAVITIDGPIGTHYRIDYSPELATPPAWTVLTNVTILSSPWHVIDWDSARKPKRFYRAVQTGSP